MDRHDARSFFPAFLVLATMACTSGTVENAGEPPPKNYRLTMAANFLDRFPSQYRRATLAIAAPHPGARDMVPGWRVCVRAIPAGKGDSDAVGIAYFFRDRHIESVTVGDPACNADVYDDWSEIQHADGWEN